MAELGAGEVEQYARKRVYHLKTKEIKRDETLRLPAQVEKVPFVYKDQDDPDSFVAQRSVYHGRATIDTRLEKSVLFFDTSGNVFTSREWKGNTIPDFKDLKISGENIWGIMTVDAMKDIEDVSKFFRKNGLPTEAIVAVHEVETVMFNGVETPVKEAKQKYKEMRLPIVRNQIEELKKKISDLASTTNIKQEGQDLISTRFLEKLDSKLDENGQNNLLDLKMEAVNLSEQLKILTTKYLENSKFIVIERAMPIGDRLKDLGTAETIDDYKKILYPVFEKLNLISKVKGNVIPGIPPPEYFETTGIEGIKRFLKEYIPKQMGTYLGRMHALGISHGYAHTSNWTLAGILVDLDTADGNIPGKRFNKIGENEMNWDVFATFSPMINAINGFTQIQETHEYNPSEFQESIETFLTAYFSEALASEIKSGSNEKLIIRKLNSIKESRMDTIKTGDPIIDKEMWSNVARNIIQISKVRPQI